jgi:hypothetical protein
MIIENLYLSSESGIPATEKTDVKRMKMLLRSWPV